MCNFQFFQLNPRTNPEFNQNPRLQRDPNSPNTYTKDFLGHPAIGPRASAGPGGTCTAPESQGGALRVATRTRVASAIGNRVGLGGLGLEGLWDERHDESHENL